MQLKDEKNKIDNFLLNQSNETRLFKSNQSIYHINDKIKALYVILNGKVESVSNANNDSIFLEKGSILGLMDLIIGRSYSKNMIASSSTLLAVIKKDNVENFFENNLFQGSLIKSLAIDIDLNKPNTWS
tara:strand:- start:103 stop:489 length:387 start_codon:yes stop_codon:yes gene_type:complete